MDLFSSMSFDELDYFGHIQPATPSSPVTIWNILARKQRDLLHRCT